MTLATVACQMERIRIASLLLVAGLLGSCVGTTKPIEQVRRVAVRPIKAKLTRSQDSTQFDEVKCGVQDAEGNLWFGTTREGVYRYDGKGFSQFTVKDGLTNNTVWSILADRNGSVWFGTDSGLSRWDGKSILRIPISLRPQKEHSPSHAPPTDPAVWSSREDKNGTIWIGTAGGMLCLKHGVLSIFLDDTKVKNPGHLTLKMVEDVHEDGNGILWFASGMPPGEEGLCRFDGTTLTQLKPGGERWIRTITENPEGVLWLGTRHVGTWKLTGSHFSQYSKDAHLGVPRLVDRSGNIWFSGEESENVINSYTGIWRYDGNTLKNYTVKDGMDELFVWCMVEDRSGNIWLGTRNMGLYRFDGKSFKSFSK